MDFKNKIILAPMAGMTDYPFRKIARRYGADYCVSEMISAKAVCFKDKKTASLAEIKDGDLPLGIQIFGHEPNIMGECVYLISRGLYEHRVNDAVPDAIDINMGCPVKKIVSSGDGSALLTNPTLCEKILAKCVKESAVPVTVKIRAGWDKSSVNCTEIAKIAEFCGVAAIAVHARTKEQMYAPGADWSYIKKVKKAVSVPVIGNGDIYSAKDALQMLEDTECDSIMIGRGALGNPFVFDEIKCALHGKLYTPPDISEKIAVIKEHASLLVSEKGEYIGICEARKHISRYVKGFDFASKIRMSANSAQTLEEIYNILNEYSS